MGTTTAGLTTALGSVFTVETAFVFLVFTLLYTPCVAAIATVKRELDTKAALWVVFFQTAVAWIVGLFVHLIGGLF